MRHLAWFLLGISLAMGRSIAGETPDPVRDLVGRLDIDRYKATIKGLTQFGDRRQGTKRNRDALDWIEAQLKSHGCSNTERLTFNYEPPANAPRRPPAVPGGDSRGNLLPLGDQQPGGWRYRGTRTRTEVNTDAQMQPNKRLRELNAEPSTPGERQNIYCTKVGSTHPGEMYLIGAHMDGHGWGEAANDDGSGTALVMELARVFSSPDVKTDRSIRFILWNNEETGLNGAQAYVDQRAALQGLEEPAGSGKYPEPRWLGMIQHDMMMWDHGMPAPDGTVPVEQRREADVNIEFAIRSKFADQAMKLAFAFRLANEKYASDYPAAVGPHMTNTDSRPFQDLVPALSLRENERGMQTGAGWNPTWHQPIDVFATFSDKDFRLGLNAAQTTLAAIAQLVGATVADPFPTAGYIPQGQIPDTAKLLPPPPQAGSAAQAFDEALHDEAVKLRGSARWNLATLDASTKLQDMLAIYSCTLGVDINPTDTPDLARLLQRSMRDAGASTMSAKRLYNRTRPFVAHQEPTCVASDEAVLARNGSYPSGHMALGWGAALVLAEVAPDLSTQILARGAAYGESRVVCNYHWQSDVIAARTAAAATVARMHAEPEFARDVAAARTELAAVRARGLPPKRDCPAEVATLKQRLTGAL